MPRLLNQHRSSAKENTEDNKKLLKQTMVHSRYSFRGKHPCPSGLSKKQTRTRTTVKHSSVRKRSDNSTQVSKSRMSSSINKDKKLPPKSVHVMSTRQRIKTPISNPVMKKKQNISRRIQKRSNGYDRVRSRIRKSEKVITQNLQSKDSSSVDKNRTRNIAVPLPSTSSEQSRGRRGTPEKDVSKNLPSTSKDSVSVDKSQTRNKAVLLPSTSNEHRGGKSRTSEKVRTQNLQSNSKDSASVNKSPTKNNAVLPLSTSNEYRRGRSRNSEKVTTQNLQPNSKDSSSVDKSQTRNKAVLLPSTSNEHRGSRSRTSEKVRTQNPKSNDSSSVDKSRTRNNAVPQPSTSNAQWYFPSESGTVASTLGHTRKRALPFNVNSVTLPKPIKQKRVAQLMDRSGVSISTIPGPTASTSTAMPVRHAENASHSPSVSTATSTKRRLGPVTDGQDMPSTSSSITTSPRPNRTPNRVQGPDKTPPSHSIDYHYPRLSDLSKHVLPDPASSPPKKPERFNVYGVVEYFKPPSRTSGFDYIMVVVLCDESLPVNGFKCCLFAKDSEAFPKVTSIGDILRLHRIKLVKYGNTVHGQSTPGWSGLVFPKNGARTISTSEQYTLTEKDNRKVEKLRKFTPKPSVVPAIKDIRHGTYVDFSCQVLAVKIINNERAVLMVWDGTKLPSECQMYGVDLTNTPQDLLDVSDGLAIEVLVFDGHKTEAESLMPGDMVKLINVKADRGRMNPNDFGLIMRGGTSYGRGIKVLDGGSCDCQTLNTRINSVSTRNSDTESD